MWHPDDVVISGISCRLPESDNMQELWENLIGGVDMVTEDDRRWTPGMSGLPKRNGKVKDLSKFDASFFGISPKQVNNMDPGLRLLIETTYEAIVDSGLNPDSLRGSDAGVFIGQMHSDAHDLLSRDQDQVTGYEMTGCSRAMLANRLSFTFDLKGPSLGVDTACSSGLEALCLAMAAIEQNRCSMALVGASNILLKPETSAQFHQLHMLSPDGTCKTFDQSGDGYCRSEGVVVLLLQSHAAARRAYLRVLSCTDNCDGHKDQGVTFPSGAAQLRLLEAAYRGAGVDLEDVTYVEAHGTGTRVGDPTEVSVLHRLFCAPSSRRRQGPLLLGSIKSNLGHTEAAAGLAGIAKVILASEHGVLPANLHYSSPHPEIAALLDEGGLHVVDKATPWPGGIVGVNSFGFGGVNVHAILETPHRRRDKAASTDTKVENVENRLVLCAGRTNESVERLLGAASGSKNASFVAMIQETAHASTKRLPFRGYAMPSGTCEINKCDQMERPLWYIFPGMGCQWARMGRDMMDFFPVFREAIQCCHDTLSSAGFNLLEILREEDINPFSDPLNAFVGICAIQIGLVDVLAAAGVAPAGLVGHSVGELGCAYADGGLTRRQTVLAAYHRGRCVTQAGLPAGAMAAVGLTWQEAAKRCPEGVVPACHNAESTVTVSGPKDSVARFVEELTEEGTFARLVDSSGIAFHSYFMQQCAPALLSSLEKVIDQPTKRSDRWISSSFKESQWNEDVARYSSAQYHVHNLTSPVLFHEALQHVPKNAICLEVGPHGLLQALLKRSIGPDIVPLSLMKRMEEDNVTFFLKTCGRLYLNGIDIQTNCILDKNPHHIAPMGTPMISPLISWNHEDSWKVPKGGTPVSTSSLGVSQKISLQQEPYLCDHVIGGRTLYPAAGHVMLAWHVFARHNGLQTEQAPVTITDLKILNASILPTDGDVTYTTTVSPSGHFEIMEGSILVAEGDICLGNTFLNPSQKIRRKTHGKISVCAPWGLLDKFTWRKKGSTNGLYTEYCNAQSEDECVLQKEDIYKELRIRGYDYGPLFQTLTSYSLKSGAGAVTWAGNWVTHLDGLIHALLVADPAAPRHVRLPTYVKSIELDPSHVSAGEQQEDISYVHQTHIDAVVSKYARIYGMSFTSAPHKSLPPLLETYEFVKNDETECHLDDESAAYVRSCVSLVVGDPHYVHSNGGVPVVLPDIEKYNNPNDIKRRNSESNARKGNANFEQVVNQMQTKCASDLEQSRHMFMASLLEKQTTCDVTDGSLNQSCVLLDRDILVNACVDSIHLKACFDLALENTPKQRVKVLLVSNVHPLTETFCKLLAEFHKYYPPYNLQFLIADADGFARKHIGKVLPSARFLKASDVTSGSHVKDIDICIMSQDALSNIPLLTKIGHRDCFYIVHTWHEPRVLSALMTSSGNHQPMNEIDSSSEDQVVHQLNAYKLSILARKSDGILTSLLLCRPTRDVDPAGTQQTFVVNVSDKERFDWVKEVQQKVALAKQCPRGGTVWLLCDGGFDSGIVGAVNCMLCEPVGKYIRCVFNADLENTPLYGQFSPCASNGLFQDLTSKDMIMNVYKDGQWGSFRRRILKTNSVVSVVERACVTVSLRGDLTSLHWIQIPTSPAAATPAPAVEIRVHHASLNFRDVMLATGRLPTSDDTGRAPYDSQLGLEFAGTTPSGEHRFGIINGRGLATHVRVPVALTWLAPAGWSCAAAATVPLAYVTAYYGLVVRAAARRTHTVLVHAAASAVGQAFCRVAAHIGCTVLATVGTLEKRVYLVEKLGLSPGHIAHSRSLSFFEDVMKMTNGRGVDVVVNSLAGDKLQASLQLLASDGHFLEIGKYDLSKNTQLGMSLFLKNVTFHGIVLEKLMSGGEHPDWPRLHQLLQEGIDSGVVVPLDIYMYERGNIEKAFRFMAEGKHIGKIVIQIHNCKAADDDPGAPAAAAALSRGIAATAVTYFSPHKVYIVTGGLGGLGFELAGWLVERGARRLVLTSRAACLKDAYQRRAVQRWKQCQGCTVTTLTLDVAQEAEAHRLIESASKLGPVGGIFHLAAVLSDGFFDVQTPESFRAVCAVKVQGTIHLDQATRGRAGGCSDLDWFVVFSSAAAGYGNAGQSNYAFANSFMERVCEKRHADGVPGKSKAIQWGFMGDVGIVQNSLGGNKHFHMGLVTQRTASYLQTLDFFLQAPGVVFSSIVPAVKTRHDTDREEQNKVEEIQSAIINILGLSKLDSYNLQTPLLDLGLDSLMTTEIRQVLARRYNLPLTVTEVQNTTLHGITELLLSNEPDNNSTTL